MGEVMFSFRYLLGGDGFFFAFSPSQDPDCLFPLSCILIDFLGILYFFLFPVSELILPGGVLEASTSRLQRDPSLDRKCITPTFSIKGVDGRDSGQS